MGSLTDGRGGGEVRAALAGLGCAVAGVAVFCQAPGVGGVSWRGVVERALGYLAGIVAVGGVWAALPRGRFRGVGVGALVGRVAAGWLFLPALALLVREHSLLGLVLGVGTGVAVAQTLRAETAKRAAAELVLVRAELFAGEVKQGLLPWSALHASLLLYGAAVAVYDRWLGTAVVLLAGVGVVLAWQAGEPGLRGRGWRWSRLSWCRGEGAYSNSRTPVERPAAPAVAFPSRKATFHRFLVSTPIRELL